MLGLQRRNARHRKPVTFDAGTGLITARAQDANGRPLAGAELVTRNKRTQRQIRTISDEFGLAVSTVTPGTYTVAVRADGYGELTKTVYVAGGEHAALGDVRLKQHEPLREPEPGEWLLDTDHTSIRFVARHIGLCSVHGRFTRFHGRVQVEEPIEHSSVEVVIDASSIYTGVDKRDDHLRSRDFLYVDRFPKIHFFGSGFRRVARDRWIVDGTLNLRGASRGVQLEAGYLGLRSWNGERLGAIAKTDLHREDFTINWQQTLAKGVVMVGSTVQIQLDIQAVRSADG